MAHTHGTGDADEGGGWRLLVALALNLVIVVAQVVGGVLSGSLAVLSDAAHNASDASALGISYFARRLAKRGPDERRTFGYARVETVAALVNLTTLVVIGLYLGGQAVFRLFRPEEVDGTLMLIVGGIAFVEDLLSVVVLWPIMKGSLNVKSAVLHLAADTATTVAVIAGAGAVLLGGPSWIDPAITLLLSAVILRHAAREIREAAAVLMDTAPEGLDIDVLVHAVEAVDGVERLRHVHVWRLDEKRTALEGHLVVREDSDLDQVEAVRCAVKALLCHRFEIEHATLEVVRPNDAEPSGDVIADE